jgi:hypothetical protein
MNELYYLSKFSYKVIRPRTKTVVRSQQYKNSKNITRPKQKCQNHYNMSIQLIYIYMRPIMVCSHFCEVSFQYTTFHRPPNGEPCHVCRQKHKSYNIKPAVKHTHDTQNNSSGTTKSNMISKTRQQQNLNYLTQFILVV